MKLKIIFGSILAIVILMMLPSASAVQLGTIEEKTISQSAIINPEIDLEALRLKYQDNPSEPNLIILFFLSLIINLLRIVKLASIFVVILLLIIKQISNNTTAIIY